MTHPNQATLNRRDLLKGTALKLRRGILPQPDGGILGQLKRYRMGQVQCDGPLMLDDNSVKFSRHHLPVFLEISQAGSQLSA